MRPNKGIHMHNCTDTGWCVWFPWERVLRTSGKIPQRDLCVPHWLNQTKLGTTVWPQLHDQSREKCGAAYYGQRWEKSVCGSRTLLGLNQKWYHLVLWCVSPALMVNQSPFNRGSGLPSVLMCVCLRPRSHFPLRDQWRFLLLSKPLHQFQIKRRCPSLPPTL